MYQSHICFGLSLNRRLRPTLGTRERVREGLLGESFAVAVNIFVASLALIVIAVSALLAVSRPIRRDRDGLIDRTASTRIGTPLPGPITAAIIWFVPSLIAVPGAGNAGIHYDSGPLTAQVGDTWLWVATVVASFWIFALARIIFVTSMDYLHRRSRRRTLRG